MTQSTLVRQLLADLLDDEQHLCAIQDILSAQRQAVLSYDQPQLDQLNQQLMNHYQQLHQHAKQRISGLRDLGLPANRQGMERLLANIPTAAQQFMQTAWDKLSATLEHCQQANSHNQQLLEQQQTILTECMPHICDDLSWLYQPNNSD